MPKVMKISADAIATESDDATIERLHADGTRLDTSTPALRGADAAAAGRSFLEREYGSAEAVDAVLRVGRPRVGTEQGESPIARTRITAEDDRLLNFLVVQTKRTRSDIVRTAIHQYLQANVRDDQLTRSS